MCLSVVTVPPLFATMLPQDLEGTNLQLFQAPERQVGAREISSVIVFVAGRVSEH